MTEPTPTPTEVQVKVTLRDRATEALVKLDPPTQVSPQRILDALAAHGVVHGVDNNAVLQLANYPGPDPVVVARATPAVNGQNAKIEYFFRTGTTGSGKPLELEDGRVDFRELGTIENVTKNQVLAQKSAATPGTPGVAVTGEILPGRDGKDVQLRAGKNTVLAEDGMSVNSLIDGQPRVDGSRVSVEPVIVVQGDVDFSTGNINFTGSVRIGGHVLPGFTIKATQDIEVNGVVEGALLEAGGKVSVKGGVRQHSVVTAHGDVSVRFVDSESSITTRANLVVVESALHSTLTAGLSVKVGKKLIGGTTQAGEFVSAESVGAPAGTHTTLDVRQSRQTKVIEQLQRAIGTLNGQLATVNQTYQAIISNPAAPQGAFDKTKEIKTQLEARLDQLQHELEERQAANRVDGPPRMVFVAAREGFHPGVHVYFDAVNHHVDSFTPVGRIMESEGQVHFE